MQKKQKQLFIICYNIRSTHNVGSIFRTADAAGVNKIYLSGFTPAPPNSKIAKVALGAENTVPYETHASTVRLIKKLKTAGIRMVALENNVPGTIDYTRFKPKFPLALILGHEVEGLPKKILELADTIISLPMRGMKESLNVSVACGVTLYEINKFRDL